MRDNTTRVDEGVKEAARRLPENLCDDGVFCSKRAPNLSTREQSLPSGQSRGQTVRRANSTLNHV